MVRVIFSDHWNSSLTFENEINTLEKEFEGCLSNYNTESNIEVDFIHRYNCMSMGLKGFDFTSLYRQMVLIHSFNCMYSGLKGFNFTSLYRRSWYIDSVACILVWRDSILQVFKDGWSLYTGFRYAGLTVVKVPCDESSFIFLPLISTLLHYAWLL